LFILKPSDKKQYYKISYYYSEYVTHYCLTSYLFISEKIMLLQYFCCM